MKKLISKLGLLLLAVSFSLPMLAQNSKRHHKDRDVYTYNQEDYQLREMKSLSHKFNTALMNRRLHKARKIKGHILSLMEENIAQSRTELQQAKRQVERLKQKKYRRRTPYQNCSYHGPSGDSYRNTEYREGLKLRRAIERKKALKAQLNLKKEILYNFELTERNRRLAIENDRKELKRYIHVMKRDGQTHRATHNHY